jgi:hypothetical protein
LNETTAVKQEKITKLLKIYMGEEQVDFDKPNLMVSYQVYPNNNGKILREDVRVINIGTSIRYYGKTPIVFIKHGEMKDEGVLNMANIVKRALEDVQRTPHERSIKTVLKNVLKGKNVLIKKSVFYGAMGDIMLKRPNKDYVAFTNSMLENPKVEVE